MFQQKCIIIIVVLLYYFFQIVFHQYNSLNRTDIQLFIQLFYVFLSHLLFLSNFSYFSYVFIYLLYDTFMQNDPLNSTHTYHIVYQCVILCNNLYKNILKIF